VETTSFTQRHNITLQHLIETDASRQIRCDDTGAGDTASGVVFLSGGRSRR
jgi:hypothetical protein